MLDIDRVLSNVLKQNFNDVKIYNERAEKIKLPAFILKIVQSHFDKKVGNLYKNELLYQIIYIENEDNQYITDYEKFEKIAFKLFDILEFIEIKGNKLKAYDMNYKIQDNTLMFFVMFKVRYQKDKERILMNELDLNSSKKGE